MSKVQLLKMLYRDLDDDTLIKEVICIRNVVQNGGEYTMCGNAWVDNSLDTFDIECIESFEGSLKDCTCKSCLDLVNYCKSLK